MATEPLSANHLNTLLQSKTLPISLRTIQLDDAPLHASLISDPANGGDPDKPLTPERSREIISAQRISASEPSVSGSDGRPASGPSRVNMVVCLHPPQPPGGGPLVIGLGGYGAIKDWQRDGGRHVRAGDVGVLLDAAYRGRGYAVEAMRLAIDWAFTPLSAGGPQLDLVTVTTLEDNVAMLRMAEHKLGLKGKGVLRPAEFDKEKQEMYYELTPEEWEAVKSL